MSKDRPKISFQPVPGPAWAAELKRAGRVGAKQARSGCARPRRRHIPVAIKWLVCWRQDEACKCGCGKRLWNWENGRRVWARGIHWDHEPALRLRDVNPEGTDYIPGQHSIAHLDARCVESHNAKTHGTGATTAGTDIGKITKERKARRPQRRKAKIRSRGFAKVKRPMRKRCPPAGSSIR